MSIQQRFKRFKSSIGNLFSSATLVRSRVRKRSLLVQQLESRKVLTATLNVSVESPSAIAEDSRNEVTFTITRDEVDDYLSAEFQINGDAIFGSDFRISQSERDTVWLPSDPDLAEPIRGTVTFEPGEAAVEVIATPINDSVTEIDESITLTVTPIDEFDIVNGGASLIVRNEETIYYVVDRQNRLGTVDVETGRVTVLGQLSAAQTINDIAITEAGNFFAITADRLYEVNLDGLDSGVIPTTFLGFHNILNANALVDARDGDFGSGDGDLFAVGENALAIQWIDLDIIDDAVVFQGTATVFNVAGALQAGLFNSDYVSGGDLDYVRNGDLILSATRVADSFDSLITIETPTNGGVIDTAPMPAEDPGENFQNIYGLAFDGNDSYAFSGHTLLSVGQFNKDVSREIEMTGREYLIGADATATATIIGDPVPAPIVQFNQSLVDPADLPKGVSPTDWQTQRSSIREISLELGWPVSAIPDGSIVLTNLGIESGEASSEVSLRADQILLDANGTSVVLSLDAGQMTDGRYQLDLAPSITTGEAFQLTGDATNEFYVLKGDWDGSGGVNILDMEIYAYWFGSSTPTAPEYMDLNDSGVVNIQDFAAFADRYGKFVEMPGAAMFDPNLADPTELQQARVSLEDRLNVNGIGGVTPLDALNVINRLASGFPTNTDWRYDVNLDGSITPRDALAVLNSIAVNAPPPNARLSDFLSERDDETDDDEMLAFPADTLL